jgi:hypothetical protein
MILIRKARSSFLCRDFWTCVRVQRFRQSEQMQRLLIGCDTDHFFGSFRKLTRRIEDLTHDSSALKSHLMPQLKVLTNMIPEIVNFGISVRPSFIPDYR